MEMECDANYYGKLCAQRCSCGPNFDCDKVNGSCYCSKGWKGSNCDIDINECTEGSHNCDPEKFEMCQNIDGGFECVCHMGYYRTRDSDDCQDVDDCNPNPCQNGGTCNDAVDGYNCACVDGYSDKNCTTDMNECDPDPCQNGATCVDEVNDYSCTCVDGYSGKNCSTNIDDCIPDPCLNGATCVDAVNDYSCTCVAGYSGKNCDADINECENEANPPCDQICTNSIGSFECACRTGYMISPQDSTKCQAISVVSVSVTFNYDVSAVDLSDENSQEYQDIKVQAKIVIETRLEQAGISVVSVIVLSLRRGSLIVDYEVIVNTEEEGDPVKVVTMAMVNTIAVGNTNSNPSSVFNSTTAISNVAIGNQQYSANDSACEIKQKSDPCSTICEEKEGVAVCKPEKEKLSINLVLGLGLGIPLFILLCLVIGILTYWWTRKQRKSALSNSRESMSERHRRVGRDMKAGIANPFNFESKYQSSDRQVPSWRKDTMSGSFRSETFPSNLRHYEAMGDYPSYAGSRDKPVNYEEPRPDY